MLGNITQEMMFHRDEILFSGFMGNWKSGVDSYYLGGAMTVSRTGTPLIPMHIKKYIKTHINPCFIVCSGWHIR
jgi:hypothetical protein